MNRRESKRDILHFLEINSIRQKVNLAVAAGGIILMFFSLWLLTDSMEYVQNDLMDEWLASDVSYLRDELGENSGAQWELRDGRLFIGEIFIGDGTVENANEEPFLRCEGITGTFFYTAILDKDKSHDSEDIASRSDYLRAAGSTRGLHGEHIEGTYFDKEAMNALENSKEGVYSGAVDVNGKKMYCRYEFIKDKDGNIIGSIAAGHNIQDMVSLMRTQKIRGFILIIVIMMIVSAGLGIIVSFLLRSIKDIRGRLDQIGTGEFPEEPLRINSHDEMEDIAGSVNSMVESLREKGRINAELSFAADIQANMLPSAFPLFPEHTEFDVYATMDPAREVGGDFYDVFMVDDTHVAVVIADVSGKGVPAALFMVVAKTLIKTNAESGLSPAEVFTKVNRMLCEGNSASVFVTSWMGILDIETGTVTYANAGHNPPLVRHGNGEFEHLKSKHGFVMAAMDNVQYRECRLQLNPGDKLFLYTDGVTEATNTEKELYGEERLKSYISAYADAEIDQLLFGLRKNIDDFVGKEEQFDDITMLILHYKTSSIQNTDSRLIQQIRG